MTKTMARFINAIFAIPKHVTAGEQMLCRTREQTIQHLLPCQNCFIYCHSLHSFLLYYKLIIYDKQVYLNVEKLSLFLHGYVKMSIKCSILKSKTWNKSYIFSRPLWPWRIVSEDYLKNDTANNLYFSTWQTSLVRTITGRYEVWPTCGSEPTITDTLTTPDKTK